MTLLLIGIAASAVSGYFFGALAAAAKYREHWWKMAQEARGK